MTTRRRFLTLTGAGAAGVVAAGLTTRPAAAVARRLNPLPPKAPTLIFGDSYTEGVGADKVTDGYAYKVGPLLDLTVTVAGKGGSGYCNPTTYGAGVYYDRLQKYADVYSLVVIQGGSNDDKIVNGMPVYDDATITAAINKVLTFARTRFTKAQIVVMAPTNPYGSAGADLVRANALVVQGATAQQLPVIDPLGEKWFAPGDSTLFVNKANGHPNNAGHAMLRTGFVRDLQVLLGR